VILMLGTNDFQFAHPYNNAWASAQGVAALVAEIRKAPIEPGMKVPPILVVCPPPIETPRGLIAAKFAGAESRAKGLSDAFRALCGELKCEFFDAGGVTTSSRVDGVHLDADQHLALGQALAGPVSSLLAR
jgi:lysophospholipase L1-like esterase